MATRLKPTEQKALAWYAENNNLKIQLSNYPKMYFLNEDGEVENNQISNILRLYKERNKGIK